VGGDLKHNVDGDQVKDPEGHVRTHHTTHQHLIIYEWNHQVNQSIRERRKTKNKSSQ
jgi:hypothetical protein